MKKMVLSLLVDNTSGVLSRVSGMFSRRGYNIDSLSVGVTENPRYSRMTVAVSGDDRILSQIKKQLLKLEEWKWHDDSFNRISINCSLNTNVENLKEIYSELKENKYELTNCYASYNFIFSMMIVVRLP